MSHVVRDERGAIMVIGVFMALFMVGALFYAIGLGQAILQREGMQDAADAAALSAAVLHARGMNLIVLINMVMAALLAVLIAIRLVETTALAAIAVLLGMSLFTGGASLSAVPQLTQIAQRSHRAYNRVNRRVQPMLRALHATSGALKRAMPLAAQARQLNTVLRHYDYAYGGIAIPTRLTLPVQDDRYDVLCRKAGEYVGKVIMIPFGPLGENGVVEGAVGSLTGSLSGWFCGGGSGQPPRFERTVTHQLPVLDARAECASYGRDSRTGALDYQRVNRAEQQRLCDEAERQQEATEVSDTGACLPNAYGCTEGTPYWERIEKARRACDPRRRNPNEPRLYAFEWQEHDVEVTYTKTEAGVWVETDRERLDPRTDEDDAPPCGTEDAIGSGWHTRLQDARGDPQPLCVEPHEAPSPDDGEPGDQEIVTYTEVTQLLGCQYDEHKRIQVGKPGENFSRRSRRRGRNVPQKVENGVMLGGEAFQLRAVILGEGVRGHAEQGVRIAVPDRAEERDDSQQGIYDALAVMGRVSTAQAEYYFDGSAKDREAWMWTMSWRARLRRLRPPELRQRRGARGALGRNGSPGFSGVCQQVNASDIDCGKVERDFRLLDSLIVH